MREVKSGSQFRKDLKRYRNDNTKLEKLYDIIGFLERCEDIPQAFKPHMLTGDYMQDTWNVMWRMIFF